VQQFLEKYKKELGKDLNPEEIDYGHLPFDQQFDQYGVRGLEIDIYNDPKGGRYYHRHVNAFVKGLKKKSRIPELKKPGFKVLHIKDVDYETNYYTFKDALKALKKWSDQHPAHLPLFVNIESKQDGPADKSGKLRLLGFRKSAHFTLSAADSIDAEIRSVFPNPEKQILTPDIIRGKYTNLNDMATHQGWPELESCRGKIIFIMEGAAVSFYIQKHESLKGRLCFIYANPGSPEAAFVVRNEPQGKVSVIQDLVKNGYIVRTRSDAGTIESRHNDYSRLNDALQSGAQIISTDYYKADTRWSEYKVNLPDHKPYRLNPVNAQGIKWEYKE
jgi:hypothetical protein